LAFSHLLTKNPKNLNADQREMLILGGIVSALILAAWFIGGRKPLEGGEAGAVAVFLAMCCVAVFGDNWFKR
jgi:hypothetical protein